ncbi:unnamed protein product [Rhodiola kirilowii]
MPKKNTQAEEEGLGVRRGLTRPAKNSSQGPKRSSAIMAQNLGFEALDMDSPTLPWLVEDDQQRPRSSQARRTLGDYTAPCVSGFQSAIAPLGIDNNWELKPGTH